MKYHRALPLYIGIALVGFTISAWAQKPKGPSIGKTTSSTPSGPSIGKSAAEGSSTKAEQGRVFNVPKVTVVRVPSNKGYLALFTVPQARVVITPLSGENEPGKPLPPGIADQEGLVVFPGLDPGNYRLEVACKDYESLDDIVSIEKGKQTAKLAPLASKFATLRIGLGKQAGDDIGIKLNGQPFPKPKVEAGQLVLERVPVGKQTFSFSKSGFSDWNLEFDIRPGNNFISATMEAETIAVTINTQPRAEVYVDDEPKREATETGDVKLNLPLGGHKVRVTLPGFEPTQKTLDLTKEPRSLTLPIQLTPIAEDAEFREFFKSGTTNWGPIVPKEWSVKTTPPIGLTVAGNQMALATNTGKPGRRFNLYRDFDLFITFQMTNGKGAAWTIRAQQDNERNYYLFELNRQQRTLIFCVYRDGECVRKDSAPIIANLDDIKADYRILLKVRGNHFQGTLYADGEVTNLKPFTDDTYRLGGVGLRSVNGIEMLVTEFGVQNLNPGN